MKSGYEFFGVCQLSVKGTWYEFKKNQTNNNNNDNNNNNNNSVIHGILKKNLLSGAVCMSNNIEPLSNM